MTPSSFVVRLLSKASGKPTFFAMKSRVWPMNGATSQAPAFGASKSGNDGR